MQQKLLSIFFMAIGLELQAQLTITNGAQFYIISADNLDLHHDGSLIFSAFHWAIMKLSPKVSFFDIEELGSITLQNGVMPLNDFFC